MVAKLWMRAVTMMRKMGHDPRASTVYGEQDTLRCTRCGMVLQVSDVEELEEEACLVE